MLRELGYYYSDTQPVVFGLHQWRHRDQNIINAHSDTGDNQYLTKDPEEWVIYLRHVSVAMKCAKNDLFNHSNMGVIEYVCFHVGGTHVSA